MPRAFGEKAVVVMLTNDLMFQSRVSGAVKAAGGSLVADRSVEKLVERCVDSESVQLAFVDLSLTSIELESAIPLLKSRFPKAKVIAFGPHVDVQRLHDAEASGADEVMTRGQFDRDLNSIVSA
jgi:DNA-binding NarL/FixJ family response regulator